MILIRLSRHCLPGAKELLHASNALEVYVMSHKAFVVIDIQNDITKHSAGSSGQRASVYGPASRCS